MNTFFQDALPEGLNYIPMWLSTKEQSELLQVIDSSAWNTDLGRRTQHFGWRYDYTSARIDKQSVAAPIPDVIRELAERLYEERIMRRVPDQVIINEYVVDEKDKQGIAPHIDSVRDFGPVVVTLSLLENWTMRFSRAGHTTVDHLLEAGSIAILSGEARYEWSHSIPPRKFEHNGGLKIARGRRLSVTFRTVEP